MLNLHEMYMHRFWCCCRCRCCTMHIVAGNCACCEHYFILFNSLSIKWSVNEYAHAMHTCILAQEQRHMNRKYVSVRVRFGILQIDQHWIIIIKLMEWTVIKSFYVCTLCRPFFPFSLCNIRIDSLDKIIMQKNNKKEQQAWYEILQSSCFVVRKWMQTSVHWINNIKNSVQIRCSASFLPLSTII